MLKIRVLFLLCICFALVSSTTAQELPDIPVPSGSGGHYGGPGIAGATGNGSASFDAQQLAGEREIPQVGAGRGDAQAPAIERPEPPTGQLNLQSGIGAFFNREGQSIERPNRTRDTSTSWAEFGGFGSATSGGIPEGAAGPLSGQWNPSTELPTAPASMAGIQDAIAAQAEAVAQATEEALNAAQAAYDQLWADYYSAIDYAAETYYNTVAASADALYAAYEEALALTTQTVDYYLDYAATFAEYCYFYPWDCYSYAYNTATGMYEDVSYLSDQPAGEVALGEDAVAVNWPNLAGAVPASSAEAYEALVVFANDQLGMVVQPLYAGTLTEEIAVLMHALPNSVQAYAALLVDAQAYWGIISGGAGAVAVGDCSAAAPCAVESFPAALSNASAGVYMLWVGRPMPGSDADALDLVTTVYPALNGLSFSKVTDVQGYGFMANAYGVGTNGAGQPATVAKLVYAGVVQIEGQTVVYAMVVVGETYMSAFNDLLGGS
jgi:hypothetical protein